MGGSVLFWFRDDLRLADNPALDAAIATGLPVHLFYILDQSDRHTRALGGAQLWWLHHALETLSAAIAEKGGTLSLYRGDPSDLLPKLAKGYDADGVFWNRRYHKAQIALDKELKSSLEASGVPVKSFNGHLLREPWDVKSKTGTPMKVFTPFWKAARENFEPASPLKSPKAIVSPPVSAKAPKPVKLSALELLPTKPNWATEFGAEWQPGETGAKAKLDQFLKKGLVGYAENRNRPDMPSTSRLAPHLRFGDISIRQVWHAAQLAVSSGKSKASSEDLRVFTSELGWREFSYHLLFNQEDLGRINVQRRFDEFPWKNDKKLLKAWQKGMTGYPIVDAGMRELWRTGFMHNRVRMIVASFLVKHLLIDWRIGEDWFWDTLLDADLANNAASWQWVAGSGADAAPYFRIFNPMLQGEKFDPDGEYVRKYVPELKNMSNRNIHAPWLAKPLELQEAGVKLGKTYPHPIVEHDFARDRALSAFKSLQEAA